MTLSYNFVSNVTQIAKFNTELCFKTIVTVAQNRLTSQHFVIILQICVLRPKKIKIPNIKTTPTLFSTLYHFTGLQAIHWIIV